MFAITNSEVSKGETTEKRGSANPEVMPADAAKVNLLWQSLAMRSGVLQPKLTIGQADDPCEREADRVADQVMRMPAPPSNGHTLSITPGASRQARRKCAECEEEEDEGALQRKESGGADAPATAPPIVQQALSSPGQPLDAETRAYFEPRFGHDFSEVRVHDDAKAAESAMVAHALAYTVGQNIAFAAGQYAPHSESGRRLLAHELTHVAQSAPGIHAFSGETGDAEMDAETAGDRLMAFDDISLEAPSPYEVFLSEAVYERMISRFNIDQLYPDLTFLEHDWPYDLGAFYDALSEHATFVNMAEADFSLLQPLALTEIEFYALRSMVALEDFLRFHHLDSLFVDPVGAFVEPATLSEYFNTLRRPADRAVFSSAQQAIDGFRSSILAYVEPAYSLLAQLSGGSLMTKNGPISTFHAALFGLYVQTEDPISPRSGGGADALAMALEEYAGYEDAAKLAKILRHGFRKAYAEAVASNTAVSIIAQAYSDRMGKIRPQPYQHPLTHIRPETVAFTNAILTHISFDLGTTLNAWQGPVSDRARGLAGFIDFLRNATTPDTIYEVVRHFENSAVDRNALYRNFLGIEPEWLDLAAKHRYILKDSGAYRYPPEPPDSAMSQAQWDLVTSLEETRSRRAVNEFITGLLAMGASVAASIVVGVISGGNPIAAAAAAGVVAGAFGASETLEAAKHFDITGAANIAYETQDLPFGSRALTDFAAEEYERTRQAALANTLTALATGGIPGLSLGPDAKWISRGLVSMAMGGFDGLASAVTDPRIMDRDFVREKVVLMGGEPGSAPTAFKGVMYQVLISALFGVVADGVIEGVHFRVIGHGNAEPLVSRDGVDVSRAEITIRVGANGEVGIMGQGGEWNQEAVLDLERTLRSAQTGGGTKQKQIAEQAPHKEPTPAPDEVNQVSEPAPEITHSDLTPQEAENAVAFVNAHPELVSADAAGYHYAPIGKDGKHKIVEAPAPDMPTGIACEIHSDSGPRVPCPFVFKGLAVGHGAVNVVITEEGHVIVRDLGTEGGKIAPIMKFAEHVLDELKKRVPVVDGKRVIHELSISHWHHDHYNLINTIANEKEDGVKVFEIKKVVINELQQGKNRKVYWDLRKMFGPDAVTVLELATPTDKRVNEEIKSLRSKWYVVPGTGRAQGQEIDTHSTVYVDELDNVRIVHMVDLRPKDIIRLKEAVEIEFHKDLTKEPAPPLTIWLLGHHFEDGFTGNKDDVIDFLDQMIEYVLPPTANGTRGIHVVSTSLGANKEGVPKVNTQLVYLLRASGFDVRLAHSMRDLEIRRGDSANPQIVEGAEWTGPEPDKFILMESYIELGELAKLKERAIKDSAEYKTLELALRTLEVARKVYIEKILEELPKDATINTVPKSKSLQKLLNPPKDTDTETVAESQSLQQPLGDEDVSAQIESAEEVPTDIEKIGKLINTLSDKTSSVRSMIDKGLLAQKPLPANEESLAQKDLLAQIEQIRQYIPEPGRKKDDEAQNERWSKLSDLCDSIISSIPQ